MGMETGSDVFLHIVEQLSSGSETDGGVDRGRSESTCMFLDPRRSADCERAEAENMYDRGTIMMSNRLKIFPTCVTSGLGGRRRKMW
jgi:hypothetical protein